MPDTQPAAPIHEAAAHVRPRPLSFSERIRKTAATLLEGGEHAQHSVNGIVAEAKVGISTLYSRSSADGTADAKDAVTTALMRARWRTCSPVPGSMAGRRGPEGVEARRRGHGDARSSVRS